MRFKSNKSAMAVLVLALGLSVSAGVGLAQEKEYCFPQPDRLVIRTECNNEYDSRTGQFKLECVETRTYTSQPDICTPIRDAADSESREDYRNSEYRDRRGYSDRDEPDEYYLDCFDEAEADRCEEDRDSCEDDDLELMLYPWTPSPNP